jgi:hypothetical protein
MSTADRGDDVGTSATIGINVYIYIRRRIEDVSMLTCRRMFVFSDLIAADTGLHEEHLWNSER